MMPCSSATKLVYQKLLNNMESNRLQSLGEVCRPVRVGEAPKLTRGASRLTHIQRPSGVAYSTQPSIA